MPDIYAEAVGSLKNRRAIRVFKSEKIFKISSAVAKLPKQIVVPDGKSTDFFCKLLISKTHDPDRHIFKPGEGVKALLRLRRHFAAQVKPLVLCLVVHKLYIVWSAASDGVAPLICDIVGVAQQLRGICRGEMIFF